MVKREEISTKMKNYSEEDKLSALEVMYMWSKGIDSRTIAGVLSNKYGSVEGLDIVTTDISSLEIRSPSESVEMTNEEVGVVIRDTFRKLQQPLLDKFVENLATIGDPEKNLLLAMIRSSLFERERIKPDDLKIAYHAIFREKLKERDFNKTLLYLEKVGIIYRERTHGNEIIIPEFSYSIQPQIEAKLPKVILSDEEKEA